MSTEKHPEHLRITSLILTICFLLTVFFLCIATVLTRGGSLLESLRYYKTKQYLTTENPGILEMASARIASLDNALSECLFFSDELGYVSAKIQYLLGKQVVNIGDASMLRTPQGYLYDMTDAFDFTDSVQEIIAFRDALDTEIPFLYVHEHTLAMGDSDADEIPPGYVDLDYSFENADGIVAAFQESGIDVLDSRQILADSGYSQDQLMLRTDHHWTPLGSLVMARRIAEEMNARLGLHLQTDLLDEERFETETFPQILLGERGQRVGAWNTPLDDVTLYFPKYATRLSRVTQKTASSEEEFYEGTFREAIIRWDAMERGKNGYNTLSNGAYGFTEAFDHYHNDNAADLTLLVFKDSYSGQIASFLSLLFEDVVVVDPRKTELDAMHFVDLYDPDAVLVGFCQQMLMSHQYSIFSSANAS